MANGNGKNGKGSNGSGKRMFFRGSTISSKKVDEALVTAPVGRPPVPINWDIVRRAAMLHCTPSEIAALMGLSEISLIQRKEFPKIYKLGWERGKMSLRREQFRRAMSPHLAGSTNILMFLGKQILHQRDYWTGELTGKDGGAIEIADATRPKLEKLTLEELKQLESLVQKATPQQIAASEEVIDV